MQAKGTEMLAVRVVTLLYDLVTEKVSAQTWGASGSLCFVLLLAFWPWPLPCYLPSS